MASVPTFVALLLCLVAARSFANEASSDVKVLNSDNFEQEVGKDRGALVEFYAPWCGHCKKLAPEFEKVATAFKKVKNVLISKVDCDEHKSLCSKYDISGFPTIKWFSKGSLKPSDYSGGRSADDLVKFVNEQAGVNAKLNAPVSEVVVLTPSNFDEIVLDPTKHVLVEFYAPWCGHCKSLAPVYEELATAFKAEKDVILAKVDADAHKDLASKYGVQGYPTLKFFPKDNKEGENYDEDRSLEDFVKFLNAKAGTYRNTKGGLTDEAGIISSLDVIVKDYVNAKLEDRDSLLKKIEEAASKVESSVSSYAKVYMKVLKAIASKGAEYPKKEYERLQRLLSGAVHSAKADELTIKKNIVSTFMKLKEAADM